MVNLTDSILKAAGDSMVEEPLFPDNLTNLTKQQSICIRAAKKLEQQCTQIEMEFFTKVHELEAQYQSRFDDLAAKRHQIITGDVSVPETDVIDCPLVYNLEEKTLEQFTKELKDDPSTSGKGVPDYWLHVLENCAATALFIEEDDLPILKHLKNITTEAIVGEGMGFILRFHFEPNQYFDNTVIEKKIVYKLVPSDIYTFESPKVAACENTPIKWKEGKNPGVNAAGESKDSFFHIFDKKEDEEDLDDDYELALLIRENVIPHATLYFTGELTDEDFDFEDDSSDESGDSDGEMMES
jgi:hypothetical protein